MAGQPAAKYDQARADAARIWNDDHPATLPSRAVIALVGNECPHCHTMLAANNYPQNMRDGRPIIYIDLNSNAGWEYLAKLGMDVGRDSKLQINGRTDKQVGLPSFITVEKGAIQGIIASGTDEINAFIAKDDKAHNAAKAIGATMGSCKAEETNGPVTAASLAKGLGTAKAPSCNVKG